MENKKEHTLLTKPRSESPNRQRLSNMHQDSVMASPISCLHCFQKTTMLKPDAGRTEGELHALEMYRYTFSSDPISVSEFGYLPRPMLALSVLLWWLLLLLLLLLSLVVVVAVLVVVI